MPAKRDSTKCLIRLLKPPAQVQPCDWMVANCLHTEGLADSRLRARKVKTASDAARQKTSRWMWQVLHRIGQVKWGHLGKPLIIVTPEQCRGADDIIPVRVWHLLLLRREKSTRAIADLSRRSCYRRTTHAALAESIANVERRPLAPAPKIHQHSTYEDERAIGTQLQGFIAKRAASSTLVPGPGHCKGYNRLHKRYMSIHLEDSMVYAGRNPVS
jgi:hypothetical protein